MEWLAILKTQADLGRLASVHASGACDILARKRRLTMQMGLESYTANGAFRRKL